MIKLQTQPTTDSCVQTCLAMMLNRPVEEILLDYPKPLGQEELIQAMQRYKIRFNVISLGSLWFDGYYTAVVPSLNLPGENHQIILDLCFARHENTTALWVYDPNEGRKNVKVYNRLATNLYSWTNLIRFEPKEF